MKAVTTPAVPSILEWRRLYQAADTFARPKPWTWMTDADLFGVQDPENGRIGWCCVLGHLGEVFALTVYLGDQGFHTYLKMIEGRIDEDDLLFGQNCLMASFENRQALDSIDLQTIRQAGLSFRGRNAWPQFRSFLPGHAPWYLDAIQARFLTLALEQAAVMAGRFVREPATVAPAPDMNRILVRVPRGRLAPSLWHDRWAPLPAEPPTVFPILPLDEVRLQRLKHRCTRTGQAWELDTFYFPVPVQDRQRPYFPKVIVIVEAGSGLALHTHLSPPPDHAAVFQESLLQFLEDHKVLPMRWRVCREETETLVRPIGAKLGIALEKATRLEHAEDYRLAMRDHFA